MAVINGDEFDNVLLGLDEADELNGFGGADILDGGAGPDALDGGDGADLLILRAGDVGEGGEGDDVLQIAESGVARAAGGGGWDRLTFAASDLDISDVAVAGVERLMSNATRLTAAQLDQFVEVGGFHARATFGSLSLTEGGAAQVALVGPLISFTLYGSTGADVIAFAPSFTGRLDVLAGSGDDRITASVGDDFLYGADGDDRLFGHCGADTLDGGAGVDVLQGGAGADRLLVRAGDTARGGGGADVFSLEEDGGVRIEGGAGVDVIETLNSAFRDLSATRIAGVERLAASEVLLTAAQLDGFEQVLGWSETATAGSAHLTRGGAVTVKLAASVTAFTLSGSGEAETIAFAGAGAVPARVFVDAAGGDDALAGLDGDDVLAGGEGSDRIAGGLGNDRFVFATAQDSAAAAPDLILGFEGAGVAGGDLIDLSLIDPDPFQDDDQALVFGSQGRGGIWLTQSGSQTQVRVNLDDAAGAEMVIRIADGATPASQYAALDFVL